MVQPQYNFLKDLVSLYHYIMARSLSTLLKSISSLPATNSLRTMVSGSFCGEGVPTNKAANSDISLKDIVQQDIKENPVMIYMKGVPDQPRCGFSSLAVRVLNEYNVPLSARNILENQELKNAVKTFSHWPTFPQIFIKGEFVGGSDIILNMHQTGELKEKLKDLTAESKKEE
ncbi:hypothetical protein C5167_043400 [Papaver somniferum]|uniref:Glutaredoxin domain-containing protein n=1 Tax=Papaver somniferum TaxID=3469 RepID=A0A4Y7L8P2_PAPSO|nr:hypothetical protein C5167_043400 [Papaver somniferum]